jgi:alpha-L-arabinofuranosidase
MINFPPFKFLYLILSGLLLSLPLTQQVSNNNPDVTVNIKFCKPGIKVSPTLYGAFFEEINRAGDGGLYAEMLQNRSFEDAYEPIAWTLLKPAAANATWGLDKEHPINSNNPTSIKLNILNTGRGEVGIANDGFKGVVMPGKHNTDKAIADWLPSFREAAAKSKNGLSLVKNSKYKLSLYVRCSPAFKGPLKVTLQSATGRVLATQNIVNLTNNWKKREVVLSPSLTNTNARLVITSATPGTIWLDMVSLFPVDTFKGRSNGLRKDMAAMITNMRPSFMRFPGGSFMEGETLNQAWRWKTTIGKIEERPGFWCIWGYRSTDGLGYHEYLQMCEDIGVEPLYVAHCGMAEKEFVPLNKLDEWKQEALDAIEYANGPVASKWGALRAKAGHPKPYNLKYVEIGNENGLDYSWGGGNKMEYKERYIPFYNAIKTKYPQINLIANVPIDAPLEIVDEHYYDTSEWFRQHANMYDSYSRKGPKIYVGEFAVRKDAGNGNLRGALAEAAFMTGMERNSDIVIMSSYAPLFNNPAWQRWSPNAVLFNSSQVVGAPSYHVQAMFAANLPDVILPLGIQGAEKNDLHETVFGVAGLKQSSREVIVKLVNTADHALIAQVNLVGAKRINSTAQGTILTSASATDENSFAQPKKVYPKSIIIHNAAPTFNYTMPANSVTILKLKAQ